MSAFVVDFTDGSKEQRDLLGGKGANLAEMTKLGLPGAARLHHHHRRLPLLAGAAARSRPSCAAEVDEHLAALEQAARPQARRPGRPAARLGALRSEVLDARDDGDGPQRRPQRRVGGGPGRESATSASPGTPTGGCCRCSARPCSASSGEPFDGRWTRPRRRGASRPTSSSTPTTCEALVGAYKAIVQDETGAAFPQDPREQLDLAVERGLRVVEHRPGQDLPAAGADPRRPGHGRQHRADGVRQPRRRLRHRGRASPATRRPDTRASTATTCPTRRARTSSPASATRSPSTALGERTRSRTTSCSHHATLERHYKDMCDIEFTVERGQALDAADPGRQADGRRRRSGSPCSSSTRA